MDSMDSWLCRPHQLLTAPEADLDTQRLLGRIFIDSTPAANINARPKDIGAALLLFQASSTPPMFLPL